MLFSTVRLILCIIAFGIMQFLNRRKNRTDPILRKIQTRRAFLLAFVLNIILTVVPFENAFLTFSSPEAAFHYKQRGKVTFIVSGLTSDLVMAESRGKEGFSVIPKTQYGWKIDSGLNVEMLPSTVCGDTSILALRYKKTNEYYIMLKSPDGSAMCIHDSYGSQFLPYKRHNSQTQEMEYTYFAHLDTLTRNYAIWINETEYEITFFSL